jgi:hypothetical protein
MARRSHTREADAAIARLATRQHRMVARWQLIAEGVSKDAIDHRVRSGRLVVVFPGVYAVGMPPLTDKEHWMAAVLASGEGAVLSHTSATRLWGITKLRDTPLHVTVPSQRVRVRGVERHTSALLPSERTIRDRIPVTTVHRTLLDVAGVVSRSVLADTFRQAESRRWVTAQSLGEVLESRPGRRGARNLRAVLADAGWGSGIKRSGLEADFQRFLRRHGFPPPDRNVHMRIGALEIEADCVWWDARLIVELDSREYHDTDSAFESDRARDRVLLVHGWRCTRVTPRHLKRDGRQLARDLRELLRIPV